MISHNSLREKIRETLPKTQRKNSQSLAALGVFMVDGTGLEPVTPCTSRNVGLKTQVSFFSEQLRLNGFSVLEMLKLYNAWIFTAILRPTNNASSYSLI